MDVGFLILKQYLQLKVTGAAQHSGDDDNIEATYWKNGAITKLVNSMYYSFIALGIAVQGLQRICRRLRTLAERL
jgi:hypothetical protein